MIDMVMPEEYELDMTTGLPRKKRRRLPFSDPLEGLTEEIEAPPKIKAKDTSKFYDVFTATEEQLRQIEPPPEKDLDDLLGNVFPDLRGTTGISTIKEMAEQDTEGFLAEIKRRGRTPDTEAVLRQYNVEPEEIFGQPPELEIETLVKQIWPETNVQNFAKFFTETPKQFIEAMQSGGRTKAKQDLLKELGFSWNDINMTFLDKPVVIMVDGVRRQLTLTKDGQAFDDKGKLVASYNPVSGKFAKPENALKDTLDAVLYSSRQYWESFEGFALGVLPNIIYPEIDPKAYGGLGAFLNDTNTQMRDNFRWLYNENKREYEDWIKKNPDMTPDVKFQEGAFQHPELLKDPRYYAYEIANIVPFLIATTGIALATGGTGAAFFALFTAGMGAVEGGQLYQDLLDAGAPEGNAAQLALVAGGLIGGLESVGRIPLLRQVSPLLFKKFKQVATKELAKRTMWEVAKKYGKNFTVSQFSEVATEVMQEVVSNAAVSVYDENRGILDNLGDIAVKTAVATLLPSGAGAGVSINPSIRADVDARISELGGKVKAIAKELAVGERGSIGGERMTREEVIKGLEEKQFFGTVDRLKAGQITLEQAQGELTGTLKPQITETTNLLTANAADVIADIKARGYDKQSGYGQFVIARNLKPEMDAKEFGRIFDSVSAMRFVKKAKQVQKPAEITEPTPLEASELASLRRFKADMEKELPTATPEKAKELTRDLRTTEFRIRDLQEKMAVPEKVAPAPEVTIPEITRLEAEKAVQGLVNELRVVRQRRLDGAINQTEFLTKQRDIAQRAIEAEPLDIAKETWRGILQRTERELALPEAPAGVPEAPEAVSVKPEAPKPTVAPPGVAEVAKAEVPPAKPPVPPKQPPSPPQPAPSGPDAVRSVFSRIETDEKGVGWKEKVRRGFHQFQVKMIDDLYAIKKFRDLATKGGIDLSIEEDPYIAARLLRGVTGKATTFLENGTFGKKFWKTVKGKPAINFTGESLESILTEVKGVDRWQDFSTYLVSRRAVDLAGRDIETGISKQDAEASIAELEKRHKDFPALAKRLYKYQDSLLVYIREMGLIDDTLLTKLRKYGNYVPFYRVMDDARSRGFMGKKMANIAKPIKRIKGSEREIINPLESIVKNTYALIGAADRNQVGIMLANIVDQNPELADMFERVKTPMARVAQVTAKEVGIEVEGLSDADAEQVFDIFRPSFFVRGDEVTVIADGKKQYYRVDADLRDALLNLDRETMGMLGKFLSLPAKWLRAGATLSPDFMIRNPARDQMTAMVFSNYNFLPGVDFVRGLAGVLGKDADYQLFRASGAEHSMMVSLDRQYLRKTFKEVVEGKKFTDYVKHPLELLQILSELGEKSTRLGEFKAGVRRGTVPLEAGYSAREVSLDFAKAGVTARAINMIIAFFNASIRGWSKMASSFKEHPVRTSAKVFAGITLPSILLYLRNRDDDRWKEIPQWQKDLFWIVMTKDNIYRIPKPFELGIIFGSGPERFLEWLDNRDPKLFKDILSNLAEAGSPGFLPQAILPFIENLTNYSFFKGQAIVPGSRKDMPPELQYTRYTSEVSKKLGELLKYPPAKIDNIINGWTGGLGRYAIEILDGILKKTGVSPDIPEPSPTLADTPVVRAFVVRNPYGSQNETVNEFYDMLDKYQEGEKYLKEMLELGNEDKFNEYKATHPELLFFYDFVKDTSYSASARYLRKVARELSELTKKEDEVYASETMTPAQKRTAIDEIDRLKVNFTKKALAYFPADEPQVIQKQLFEADKKLGDVIEDVPVLSRDKPDIFDMRKLSADYNTALESMTSEDLKGKSVPKTALDWFEKEKSEKLQQSFANMKIREINADTSKGNTFEDYFSQWQELQAITDPKERAEFLKEYPKAYLGNLSKKQVELLRQYHKLDNVDQEAFLKKHPELDINPRTEWLKANPEENARLALWGQAPILTKKAYDQFKKLTDELDISEKAIPGMTLPPEKSIDTHFEYLKTVEEKGAASWEARLLLAKDKTYREWRELDEVETPLASLELKIKHRPLSDLADSYSNKESANYIADDKLREKTIAELKAKNPEWVDDTRRIQAIENNGEKLAEDWVKRGKVIDQFEAGSSEAKVWLLDNSEVHKWALDNDLLEDDGSDWNEPVLRINAKWRNQDKLYNSLPAEGDARSDFLARSPEYRQDRLRREAWQLKGDKGEIIPEKHIEDYVAYYETAESGKRRDRFLKDNPDFYNNVWLGIMKRDPVKFDKVPHEEYDNLYDEFKEQFDKWDAFKDPQSKFYVADPDERRIMRERLLRQNPDFADARIKRTAYSLLIGNEKYVPEYVEYENILTQGKPKGAEIWYADDRYLKEHQGFYRKMRELGYWTEEIDFDKVASEKFENFFNEHYSNLPKGSARIKFRETNEWFDQEGVNLGFWKPVGKSKSSLGLSELDEILKKPILKVK